MTFSSVFVSYSHDSEAHQEWVLSLSERLRVDGIPTEIDQYVQGTPAKGWPRWMQDQLEAAAFVLVICTETYYRRFRGQEKPGRGKGADWEGALITQEMYDDRSDTVKFVPVLRTAEDERFIPGPLSGHTRYVLTSEVAYGALRDFLLGQAGVEPGAVGAPKLRPRRKGTALSLAATPAGAASRRPIHLPYPSLGDLFKGRKPVLDALRSSFEKAGAEPGQLAVRVLHGLGGVGKTRTAVEYGWRHAADHSAVLFVDAESAESLGRNLAALAGPLVLNLPEQEATEDAVREAAVLRWLQEHPTWLLILDNLDSRAAATAAEAVLARLRGGHVLLTGRIAEWSGGLGPVELPLLDLDTATNFLLARTDAKRRKAANDASAARAVAARLGRLALALEQAGAYIAHQRLTFDGYLEAWDKRRARVLEWYDARVMHYSKSLALTWQTSFEQLTEAGKSLLRRLAWLAAEPIPESLLDVAAAGDYDFDAREALAELENYSLVTRAGDAATFTVHRLVQEVTRLGEHEDRQAATLMETLNWINNAFRGEAQDVRNWPTLDLLSPHARAVAEHADEAEIHKPTYRLISQLAVLLFAKARFAEAEPLLRRSVILAEQALGPEDPEVAAVLSNLGSVLGNIGRHGEAEIHIRRATEIKEKRFGTDHPEVANTLSNLGALLVRAKRYPEAEPLLRRALAIVELRLGLGHAHVAWHLNNLAAVLAATDRWAEAERLMRRSLAIAEEAFGSDDPRIAVALRNLSRLLSDAGHVSEAETLMRRALAIHEKSFGAESPAVAADLKELALLLETSGRIAEAESLLLRTQSIVKSVNGID